MKIHLERAASVTKQASAVAFSFIHNLGRVTEF